MRENVQTAMNTILTTFNNPPAYTVVGGLERKNSSGVSVVVLDRGTPYNRAVLFEDLEKLGFDYIVSFVGNRTRYDIDGLSASFPSVRFIISEDVSCGEEINIAALELSGSHFLVIWNDMRILKGSADSFEKNQKLCLVPVIQNGKFESLPTLFAPLILKGQVKTHPFEYEKEGQLSIFPFDGIGLYERESFLRLGGFDRSLSNFYWQLMDFGFRAHLWGEEISASNTIKISYEGSVTPKDLTGSDCFRRFYLKNLAPVFRGDHANLPLRRFPGFLFRSKTGLFTSLDEFNKVREWVKLNQFRFRCDARTVAELWGGIP